MENTCAEVTSLTVRRGRRTVLDDLSLTIDRGSLTGLVGPSGCGKTTLIRCLAGTQRITSGTVTVLGEPAGSARNRSRVGYATQASSVYPDLTARQNLEYVAALTGGTAADVDRVLMQVDLSDRASQVVGTLSGGQRGRVSLAGALLARPSLCLLDEPTVGLDPALRRDLWHLFAELAADGATVLVSSHVMDEAGRCDRVLLMRDGRLLVDDSPDGIRRAGRSEDLEEAFLTIAEADAS